MPHAVTCPVCEREADSINFFQWPFAKPAAIKIIRKIQPNWKNGDGICRRCFDSILKTVDDAEGQAERLDAQTGIRAYYRRVLTSQESRLWNHQNLDLATWRRKCIIEETAMAAAKDGIGAFLIFDVDEGLLAQGAGGEPT